MLVRVDPPVMTGNLAKDGVPVDQLIVVSSEPEASLVLTPTERADWTVGHRYGEGRSQPLCRWAALGVALLPRGFARQEGIGFVYRVVRSRARIGSGRSRKASRFDGEADGGAKGSPSVELRHRSSLRRYAMGTWCDSEICYALRHTDFRPCEFPIMYSAMLFKVVDGRLPSAGKCSTSALVTAMTVETTS